jgi:hypothetical protein
MPIVFSRNTGRVISLPDAVAAGAISLAQVSGSGGNISYAVHNTIITRVGVSAAGNYQFLHTIGNDVYVYVFGDRMGQIVIHGLSFAQKCTGGGGSDSGPHGFEKLFEWYEKNRIAVRKAPVTVTIGIGKSFEGFVTALSGDVQDTQHRTIQFQLTVSLLPPARN